MVGARFRHGMGEAWLHNPLGVLLPVKEDPADLCSASKTCRTCLISNATWATGQEQTHTLDDSSGMRSHK